MAECMVIDADEWKNKKPEMNSSDQGNGAKKSLKRKRDSAVEPLTAEQRETRIHSLREELESLFKYYKEVANEKPQLDLSECGTIDSAVACLLEESSLSLTNLVCEIYEKMKAREGGFGSDSAITAALVKALVIKVGQRSLYGLSSPDADVLEDETESCLWCWETRELKLMPKSVRDTLKNRRTCRKKINERILAVSDLIAALQKSGNDQIHTHDFTKASERLCKVKSEADIRKGQSLEQKDGANVAGKKAKREEKQLIKQLERNKREAEKEKKRLDREVQKERLQSEKEQKRLQEEAEKDEKRREKEESELRKQLRRQQEEAEKDQRRREKEEAEVKKQLSLKKQASLMERFLQRSKDSSSCQNDVSRKATILDSSSNRSENIPESVTHSMDCALSLKDNVHAEGIRESHLISWHCLGQSIRSNSKQHWGLRRKPKTEIIKKLKLSTNRGVACDDELSLERLVDGWEETRVNGRSCDANAYSPVSSSQRHHRSKQLLQFDKSHRPAFYGIWPKKSEVIGPRHPFKKDQALDYDIDSDEEWEEEEPGESLSDCDKDDEEEGYIKAEEEDDSEDGFFVPDGYLSENEGVQVDRKESDCVTEETNSSSGCKQELESDDICVFLRQQKYLHKLTEKALRKNRPLIISNIMHDQSTISMTEELSGTPKPEQMCLQALSMCVFPCAPAIEISIDNNLLEGDQETSTSNSKDCTTPAVTVVAILDSDLPQFVSTIQSCPHGITKVVEFLQQKFPSMSKTSLRNKVREVSDFVDNRWKVKKDVLDKLGSSISPEKGGGKSKSIATFFSKRCLPPGGNGKIIDLTETSPVSSQKHSAAVQLQQGHIYDHQ